MNYPTMESNRSSDVIPLYSRLFVVCGTEVKVDSLKKSFSEYGEIEDFYFPVHHDSGRSKGIAYVKYFKTSQAAAALEALNMRVFGDSKRPVKVMVATSRSGIQTDEHDQDDKKYKRIFIHVKKSDGVDEIKDEFSQFGHVESVVIPKNRGTGESNGLAYVSFSQFSAAAKAIEECDKKFKAIFALPKAQRKPETAFQSKVSLLAEGPMSMRNSLLPYMDARPDGFTRVFLNCSPYLTTFHIRSLFDLIPGMVDCKYSVDLMNEVGRGLITYSSPMCASYAVKKLNNFEYPPGSQIFVKPDYDRGYDRQNQRSQLPNAMSNLQSALNKATSSVTPDLVQLTEAIAVASKLVKEATEGLTDETVDSNNLGYCSVQLPPPQPMADIDSPVAKRCFLVCKPQPPPLKALQDVFCRFGDLINVYTLPNKIVGYARYASVKAADEAMKTLHGAEVCGVRIKVLEAEEERPLNQKRRRSDHYNDKGMDVE